MVKSKDKEFIELNVEVKSKDRVYWDLNVEVKSKDKELIEIWM